MRPSYKCTGTFLCFIDSLTRRHPLHEAELIAWIILRPKLIEDVWMWHICFWSRRNKTLYLQTSHELLD